MKRLFSFLFFLGTVSFSWTSTLTVHHVGLQTISFIKEQPIANFNDYFVNVLNETTFSYLETRAQVVNCRPTSERPLVFKRGARKRNSKMDTTLL